MTALSRFLGTAVFALGSVSGGFSTAQNVDEQLLTTPEFRNALINYEVYGRDVTIDTLIEPGVFTRPDDWAAENGLNYLGAVKSGEIVPEVMPDEAGLAAFVRDQSIYFFKDGKPLTRVPPLALDNPRGFGLEQFANTPSPLANWNDDDLLRFFLKVHGLDVGCQTGGARFDFRRRDIRQEFELSDRTAAETYIEQMREFSTAAPCEFVVPDFLINPDVTYYTTGDGSDYPDVMFVPEPDIVALGPMGGVYQVAEQLPRHVVDRGENPDDPTLLESGFVECKRPDTDEPITCALGTVALKAADQPYLPPNCSGIVISPRHVLTAAHCAIRPSAAVNWNFFVSERYSEGDTTPKRLGTADFVAWYPGVPESMLGHLHPGLTGVRPPAFFENPDLVILRMKNGKRLHRIRVPKLFNGNMQDWQEIIAVGYGENPVDFLTGKKQIVTLDDEIMDCETAPLTGMTTCDPEFEFVDDNAGIQETPWTDYAGVRTRTDATADLVPPEEDLPKDTCVGDSGGPIFVKVSGAWYLAAITSRAAHLEPENNTCTGKGGIYVRLAHEPILKWIDEILVLDGCTKTEGDKWVEYEDCPA